MAEQQWTPGPWYPGHLGGDGVCQCKGIDERSYAGGIATVHLHNGIDSIADGGNDCPPREEAIANMHLIAASPRIARALEAALGKEKGWRALARTALAVARGEENER